MLNFNEEARRHLIPPPAAAPPPPLFTRYDVLILFAWTVFEIGIWIKNLLENTVKHG